MTDLITLGVLTLIATQQGPFVTVEVTGSTGIGGTLHLSIPEWHSLRATADLLAAADRRAEGQRVEIERLTALAMNPGATLHGSTITEIAKERDEYHEMLRAILAACDDSTRASIGKDAPLRAVRKVIADRDSLRQQVRELMEERDAYRRAKQENDERFVTERDRLRSDLTAAHRELERWRHGVTVEGDYVCPDSLALTQARADLAAVLVSMDAMAERIEQMRPVFDAAADWRSMTRRRNADWRETDAAHARMVDAIDTALARTASEQAKEKDNG